MVAFDPPWPLIVSPPQPQQVEVFLVRVQRGPVSSVFLWLQQSEAPLAILVCLNCPSLPLGDPSQEHCKRWPVGLFCCVFEAGRVTGSALWSHHHHITTVWTLFSLPLAGIRPGHTNSYEICLQNTPEPMDEIWNRGDLFHVAFLPPLPLSFILCFYFPFRASTKTARFLSCPLIFWVFFSSFL